MVLYNIDYFKNLSSSWEYRFNGDEYNPPESKTYAELHDEKVEECRKLTGYNPKNTKIIGDDVYFSCNYENGRQFCENSIDGNPLSEFRPCWSCKIKAAYELKDEFDKE